MVACCSRRSRAAAIWAWLPPPRAAQRPVTCTCPRTRREWLIARYFHPTASGCCLPKWTASTDGFRAGCFPLMVLRQENRLERRAGIAPPLLGRPTGDGCISVPILGTPFTFGGSAFQTENPSRLL